MEVQTGLVGRKMNPYKYLELAAKVSRLKDDGRTFFHGAVGLRKDGVIVCAPNGPCPEPTPEMHAERRVLRKLGKGGIVFVVRTLADGTWAESTPCDGCMNAMRAMKVHTVHFTSMVTGPWGSKAEPDWIHL